MTPNSVHIDLFIWNAFRITAAPLVKPSWRMQAAYVPFAMMTSIPQLC